jgi:inorganic phosphate transporter, PiT family
MDAALAFPVLVGLVAVALFFDFLNGLHDAANSIATIVSTRVLRPQYAVFWAAFFNFIAFLFSACMWPKHWEPASSTQALSIRA